MGQDWVGQGRATFLLTRDRCRVPSPPVKVQAEVPVRVVYSRNLWTATAVSGLDAVAVGETRDEALVALRRTVIGRLKTLHRFRLAEVAGLDLSSADDLDAPGAVVLRLG